MAYVRMSVMRPVPGKEKVVDQILEDLLAHYLSQPGFIAAYRLVALDESGEVGRISLWESEADANRTALTQHDLAVRSELHLIIQPGHTERAFEAVSVVTARG